MMQKRNRNIRKMKFVELAMFSRDADKHTKASDIPPITRISQFNECMDNMLYEYTRIHTDHTLINMVTEYVRDMKYSAVEKYNADKYVAELVALDRHIRQEINADKGKKANWRISSRDKETQRKLQRLNDELQKATTAAITATSHREYRPASSGSSRHGKQRNSNTSSNSNRHICYKYNGENAKNNFGKTVMCTQNNCKYKHICIICKADHSRCDNATCKDVDTTPHHRP